MGLSQYKPIVSWGPSVFICICSQTWMNTKITRFLKFRFLGPTTKKSDGSGFSPGACTLWYTHYPSLCHHPGHRNPGTWILKTCWFLYSFKFENQCRRFSYHSWRNTVWKAVRSTECAVVYFSFFEVIKRYWTNILGFTSPLLAIW